MIESLPAPADANTSPVPGSKNAPSQSSPMGTLWRTLPVWLSTTISLPSQLENSVCVLRSSASPDGPSQPAIGHVAFHLLLAATITASHWEPSRLIRIFPCSSYAK